MPLYNYFCACGYKTEEFRKIDQRDDAPEHCGKAMKRKIMPTSIQADIQPYMSVAVDKETGRPVGIHSRKQHREFLKRNDYVEIGNDFTEKKRDYSDAPDAPMVDVNEYKKKGWIEEDLV